MNMFLSHPTLDVLYNPLLDGSEHACKVTALMVILLQENNQTTKGYIQGKNCTEYSMEMLFDAGLVALESISPRKAIYYGVH